MMEDMQDEEVFESTTQQLYYRDGYLQEADCVITKIDARPNRFVVFELDRTIFYPEGGGQPTDQGEVTTESGSIKIDRVRWHDGHILHEGKMVGTVSQGQSAKAVLKWGRRHKNMRVHSAGHLLHDVLISMVDGLKPLKGNHGEKAYLEYEGIVDPSIKDELEQRANEAVQADLPVRTWESSYDEIIRLCKFIPANLPTNKKLRLLRIDEFSAMPDGGVQVKSTREIGRIVVFHITNADNKTTIRYGVSGPAE